MAENKEEKQKTEKVEEKKEEVKQPEAKVEEKKEEKPKTPVKKKVEDKKPVLEREYVIPLREKCRVVPRYRKTEKAIKTVKEFLAKHMKVYDRDLNKIKLDKYVNEFLWARGIRNPPHKIKVKATRDKDASRLFCS